MNGRPYERMTIEQWRRCACCGATNVPLESVFHPCSDNARCCYPCARHAHWRQVGGRWVVEPRCESARTKELVS